MRAGRFRDGAISAIVPAGGNPVRHILFGYHPPWAAAIIGRIDHDRFAPSFGDPARIDPARFDAVIPLRIADYAPLRGQPGTRAIIPAGEAVALCDDKLALGRHLRDAGFGRYLPRLAEDGGAPPWIVKPRHGEFGAGCRIVDTPVAIDDDMVAQELIAGDREFALHILRAGGRIRYHGAVRYDMAGDRVIRGAAAKPLARWAADASGLLPLADRMLAAIGYEGTCCLNFKLREGRPIIFEINPRFGGSLTHDINAYVDAYCAAIGSGD